MFVILDNWFEPPRLHVKCREWINLLYGGMKESEHFGMALLDDTNNHYLQLEEV